MTGKAALREGDARRLREKSIIIMKEVALWRREERWRYFAMIEPVREVVDGRFVSYSNAGLMEGK